HDSQNHTHKCARWALRMRIQTTIKSVYSSKIEVRSAFVLMSLFEGCWGRLFPLRLTNTAASTPWLLVLFLATVAAASQSPSSSPGIEIEPPDLDLILQRLEDVERQDPAQSRPYEVTRE